jgi:hypothetical protein
MYFIPFSQQTPLTSVKGTNKSVFKKDIIFILCEVETKYPSIICIYRGFVLDALSGLSLRSPGFGRRPVHDKIVVDEVALGRGF